ncbi:MAG: N-formylglutamate amidohydrolase [Arenicellales bacterium]
MDSLFEPEEDPAYTLLNEDGAAPLLIACDHASNQIPRSLEGLGIDPDLYELHIAYDIGTRQVGMMLMEMFDAPLLLSNYSRLVVDLNRHHDDPTMITKVSDGHVIHGNLNLSETDRELRLSTIFDPYHAKYSQLVDRLKQKFVRPMILSVHSFTEHFQGFDRPWHFGVLWDKDKELAIDLLEKFHEIAVHNEPELVIGDNQPYNAKVPMGYSQIVQANDKNVEMALIEIRQDLVVDEKGQSWAAEVLYDAVYPLLTNTTVSSKT